MGALLSSFLRSRSRRTQMGRVSLDEAGDEAEVAGWHISCL